MRKHYLADNGAPCWRCSKTSYGYAVDDAVSYVDAHCFNCGADNMFYPKSNLRLNTPEIIALVHRNSHDAIMNHDRELLERAIGALVDLIDNFGEVPNESYLWDEARKVVSDFSKESRS
jgi:hypothetical protein